MNEFYKLLIYFKRGEMITRFFLLRKPGVTEELIDEALRNGYIVESYNYDKEIRYTITARGIDKRDK